MKLLGFKLYQLQLPSEDYIVQKIKFLGIGKLWYFDTAQRIGKTAFINLDSILLKLQRLHRFSCQSVSPYLDGGQIEKYGKKERRNTIKK